MRKNLLFAFLLALPFGASAEAEKPDELVLKQMAENTPAYAAIKSLSMEKLFEQVVADTGNEGWCHFRAGKCPVPQIVVRKMERKVWGEFDPRYPNVINMNSDIPLNADVFNETVYHEMVHYMQWMRGKLGVHSPCAEVGEAEREAYKLTSAFLKRYGIDKPFLAEQTLFVNLLCLY